MLAVARRTQIKEILLEKKSVTVTELSKRFSVTEETIRRDLQQLEDEGFLTRTYGGAFIQEGVLNDVDLALRETAYVDSKELIAAVCAEHIHHGDTIFLDASTTATFIAKHIKNMRVTVVTNSMMAVDQLKDSESVHLICIGGTYSIKSKAFNGNATLRGLADYYLDKAFLSCRALSMDHGITDSNEEIAAVRQMLLKSSNKSFLIADRSKFDKTSFVRLCSYDDIDAVVSDYNFSQEWIDFLQSKNVEVLRCKSTE